jgi:hypothetical protein
MKEGKGLSLATRVAVYVALSVSLMYIISTLLIARVTDRVLMDEANKSARNMLEITSARIEQVLKSTEANTSAVAWVARESITDDRRLYMITKRFVEETPVITG